MRVWIALALVATAFAGCAEEPAPEVDDELAGEFDDLEATDDTGVIRGVVVDATISPVADVEIQVLNHDLVAISNENGAFGFDGLEPGSYFLTATRVGFIDIQVSADVVAGEAQPPVVKVLMERDESFNPYANLVHHQGYYQCGLAFVVICGAPNVLLGDGTAPDSSTYSFFFDGAPVFTQTEMVWETTQNVSPDLRMEIEADGSCAYVDFGNVLGPSPLVLSINETRLTAAGIGGPECGLYHSVFAGDILEQQHCFAWGSVPLVKCGVGFALEQKFDWFITDFHGFAPPEGWMYITHGMPTPPS